MNPLNQNLSAWHQALVPCKGRPAKILEIGALDGRSAAFFLEFLPQSTVTCIDCCEDVKQRAIDQPIDTPAEVELLSGQVTASFSARVRKLEGHPHDLLIELRRAADAFDVIYIGGGPQAASALLNARLAWKLLIPGGVVILDDYEWKSELPDSQRPRLGIDEFLATIEGEYELLHLDYQVIIRKSARNAPDARTIPPRFPLLELTLNGKSLDAQSEGDLSPPLVSFVLINWNYGSFVRQAIESIKRQDYRRFECLVIDNGSSDDSVEVIRNSIEGDGRFRLHQFARNMGQLGAALWSLDEINGRFVTFVDADDVLFPGFASTHLQTHLALPRSVAFTSSATTEMNSHGELISSRRLNLGGRHIQKGLRLNSQVVRFPAISDDLYASLSAAVGIVPQGASGWHWGPGTANMFRKSVLDMVRFGDKNQPIMRAADGHFNRICHALAGSGLIDLPLSGYRIHGHNYFARNENIDGLSRGGIQKAEQIEEEFVATSEVLLENAIKLSSLLGRKYWGTIDQCLGASGGISLRRYRSRSVHQIFMRHAEVLRAAHGERKFCREIGKRFSYSRARAILKKGLGREPSAKSTAMLLLHSGERHVLAVSRALKLGEPRR